MGRGIITAFNKRGIDVKFADGHCQITRNGSILFEAEGEDGVFKVKTKSIAQATSATEVQQ